MLPHSNFVRGVAFSPDGETLATAADDGLRLWQSKTGEVAKVLVPEGGFGSAAFSPDGQWLAYGCGYGRGGVWNVISGVHVKEFLCRDRHRNGISSVAFNSTSKMVLAATTASGVKLWDREKGAELFRRRGHDGGVASLAINSDGALAATASDDGTVKLWDLLTQRERLTIPVVEPGEVHAVAFSPDGTQLATGDSSYRVQLWNAVTGDFVRTVRQHGNRVTSVAFSPDGKSIASGSIGEPILGLSDVSTGNVIRDFKTEGSKLRTLAFSPDGQVIASVSELANGSIVKLCDVASGSLLHEHREPLREHWSLAFSPDSQTLGVASEGGLSLWDVKTGENRRTLPGNFESVAFDADGQTIWTSTFLGGSIQQFTLNPPAGQSSLLRTIPLGAPVSSIPHIVTTPDGRHLVTLNGNGTLYVLRINTRP